MHEALLSLLLPIHAHVEHAAAVNGEARVSDLLNGRLVLKKFRKFILQEGIVRLYSLLVYC